MKFIVLTVIKLNENLIVCLIVPQYWSRMDEKFGCVNLAVRLLIYYIFTHVQYSALAALPACHFILALLANKYTQ